MTCPHGFTERDNCNECRLENELDRLRKRIVDLEKTIREVRHEVFDEYVPARLSAKVARICEKVI